MKYMVVQVLDPKKRRLLTNTEAQLVSLVFVKDKI